MAAEAIRSASAKRAALMNRAALLLMCMTVAHALSGCDNKPVASAAPSAPAVTVAKPFPKVVAEWDEYTGRFTAVETVEVRARVSGFIDAVKFNEGQIVKKDDLLFVVDQRPYRIAVEQAKADVDRAKAKLELAEVG